MSSYHPAVSALGYGLGLHAELIPGDRQLGVLPADGSGAAGSRLERGQTMPKCENHPAGSLGQETLSAAYLPVQPANSKLSLQLVPH